MARGIEAGGSSIGARVGAGPRIGAGVEAGVARIGSSTITIAGGSSNPGRSEVSRNTQSNSFIGRGRTLGGENVSLSGLRDARLNYFANKQAAREAQTSAFGTHTESPITRGNSFRSSELRIGGENVPLRRVGEASFNYFANKQAASKTQESASGTHTESPITPKKNNSFRHSIQPSRWRAKSMPSFGNEQTVTIARELTTQTQNTENPKPPETETQLADQQDINEKRKKEEEKVEVYEYTKPNRMPDTIVSLTTPRRIF